MKIKALVTGGAGFLGSHLCKELLKQGRDVVCVDNFLTGKKKNIIHLLDDPYFELLRHDITVPLISEVEEIYNLACPASPLQYQKNPVKTTQTSILGAINMLELARRTGAKILQASTSEVYGDPDEHPQSESYHGKVNFIGERACYDEGKRCAETLFFDYQRQHDIPIRVVRIFNTYGPHMSIGDGRVISNFIVQALRRENITVYGTGAQTRSFCYVDDLITAIISAMEYDHPGPMNIGNPAEEINMHELAKLVRDLSRSKSDITFKQIGPNDPQQRRPLIDRAQKHLSWAPTTTLKQGLSNTIRYFRGIL